MDLYIHNFGFVDYHTAFAGMMAYTASRTKDAPDYIWLLQHPSVYTLGLSAHDYHFHQPGEIPVVKTDRGGQVTYHGPGQLIAYVLVDLKRQNYGVRGLVNRIEQSMIDTLATYGIEGERRKSAPGIYVANAKIAALGLRIKNGCSYHGIALNIDMDLEPFSHIDSCGYPGLEITQLRHHGIHDDTDSVAQYLGEHLNTQLQQQNIFTPKGNPVSEAAAHD